MACQGIFEQVWYWADVDKSVVSRALADQPDGAFIVRNASTPGDFTLSVKYNGQVKLVKIIVQDGKCGFTVDTLTHSSIVKLIEFHRNYSLSAYNDNLDIRLLYPVPARRNSQNGRPIRKTSCMAQKNIFKAANSSNWDERLGLERLRIAQMGCERAARLYDVANSEVDRAENLFNTLSKSIRDYEVKLERLNDLVESEEQITKNMEKKEQLEGVMTGNRKLLDASIKRISNEMASSQAQKSRIGQILEEMKADLLHAKNRLLSNNEVRNKVYADLVAEGVHSTILQTTVDTSQEMILVEPLPVSQLLADLPLRWVPSQYLSQNSSKEDAAQILMTARDRMLEIDKNMGIYRPPIDGVFLIRPSATQPDKLVLSVLYGERISHCLIEQSEQGWGFANSNIFLTTIGDFVRYYAWTSLESHNDNIKTALTMPAFPLNQPPTTPTSPVVSPTATTAPSTSFL